MKPSAWRFVSLAYGVLLLLLAIGAAYANAFQNATPGFDAKLRTDDTRLMTVSHVTDPAAVRPPIAVGDTLRLADPSFANRLAFSRMRAGERFTFVRTDKHGRTSTVVATMQPRGPAGPATWSFLVMTLAFVFVGMTIAARRPDDPQARLLVGLFLSCGTVMLSEPQPYMPLWLVAAAVGVRTFMQAFVAYAALALAVAFPRRSTSGVRAWIARANVVLLGVCVLDLALQYVVIFSGRSRSAFGMLMTLGLTVTALYYAAIVAAFVLAARGLGSADRKRLQWVAWTIGAGFSGELVLLVLIAARIPLQPELVWLNITLIAIPFGLGYAIVRHRVVDIGFVVNRALVFAIVSGIVLLAFGALEWILGNVLVSISHVTSAALELALALALGFSLRSIHARADAFVDDLFFRARHEAERALRAFARDVGFVTDPGVALARTHDELLAHTGAAAVAIYVVDADAAVRADLGEGPGPARVDENDPALVRLRATRAPLTLRHVRSALAGDRAFPMCVRDALTGVVVLTAKTSGEAYAPDEVETVQTVVTALASSLDALHTAALKAELARVLGGGAALDDLRGTLDSAAWVRGVLPQPAGQLPGLIE